MAEHCRNCGTELLAGQRFCRLCGTPISDAQREELPTKVFSNERQASGGAAAGGAAPASTTASQSGRGTDPFSPFQQPTAHQSPVAYQQTTPLYLPPDQPSSKSRAMLFLIIGLIGMALLSGLLLLWASRQSAPVRTAPPSAETEIPVPPPPPPPPPPVEGVDEGAMLDEADAVETDNETVITKTYALASNATFAIREINGNVEIEGWDESKAEVKIIKRGGTIEDRKRVRINSSQTTDRLSFQTSPIGSGGVEVRYEVRLPRGQRRVELNTVNADVKIADVTGAIDVKAQNASVELSETSGTTAVKLVNGRIRADYEGVKQAGPQQLSTVNGRIEVQLDDDTDAELQAETVSGSIDLDGDFGFQVEKKIVGQKASGRIGDGGPLISIRTVNGPIKISN